MQVVVLSKKQPTCIAVFQSTRFSQDKHYRKDWGYIVAVLQSESVFPNNGQIERKLMYANVLVLQFKIKKPKTTKQPRLILL